MEEGRTASAISQENGWDDDNTERLLNTLTALKLVHKNNGKWGYIVQ